MGQSVSNQLGIGTLGVGADPEFLRSQILQQRERQLASIQNPQQQLAARLGGLLGGGIANVAQDRGFFEVSDPLLTKVSQISGIYNQVAQQIDPAANPEQFYTELANAYRAAGLGQQALMSMQEAQKAKTTGMDTRLKEIQLLEKDVESIPAKIQAAQERGDMAEAQRLSGIYNRVIEGRELDRRAKESDIQYKKALSSQAGREQLEALPLFDQDGKRIGTEIYNKNTKRVEYTTKAVLDTPTIPKKPEEKKPDLTTGNKFFVGGNQPAAPTTQQTTWSGVPINPAPVAPPTQAQQRDMLLMQTYPTIPVATLSEEAKQQMYLNLLQMTQGR